MKRILFIGIAMNSGGTENAFLSLLSCFDYEKYAVTLLLAKNRGAFISRVPPQVTLKFMPKYGDLFLLSGKNAFSNMLNTFVKKNPLTLFEILPFFLKLVLSPKSRVKTAIRLFCAMMRKTEAETGAYDAAVAFWGDRTMFYMVDKVPNAKKKIAWMHFDYGASARDDEIYLKYFSRCDKIINVSPAVDGALKAKFPQIADKCAVIENIQNAGLIRALGEEAPTFPDPAFGGFRLLSVGRVAPQKGFDLIPPVLARLEASRLDARWYIIGADGGEKAKIEKSAEKFGVRGRLVFLGETRNPYPFIKNCDVYVQPSRFEGKPLSVEEAKILCRPIVAANYLSASEQLKGGEFGLIAETTPDGVFEKIKLLLDNPPLRERFSEALKSERFAGAAEIEKLYAIIG